MAILRTETTETVLPDARVEGERLWLLPGELEAATGWSSRPEGLCRGSVCVPIPPGREREFLRGAQIDAATLWRHLGQPLAHSADGGVWVLGTAAADRSASLRSLEAPDLHGAPDRLHARGRCAGHRLHLYRRGVPAQDGVGTLLGEFIDAKLARSRELLAKWGSATNVVAPAKRMAFDI